jgi:hypothetical protein
MKIFHLSLLSFLLLFTSCTDPSPDGLEYSQIPVSSNALISPKELNNFPRVVSGTVYVSVYSNLINFDTEEPISLQSLISIRNTDANASLLISSAEYYDVNGKLIRTMIESPVSVGPLGTHELVVKTSDLAGGSGAKCIITWQSGSADIQKPLVESLTTDLSKGTGISFFHQGVTLTP